MDLFSLFLFCLFLEKYMHIKSVFDLVSNVEMFEYRVCSAQCVFVSSPRLRR